MAWEVMSSECLLQIASVTGRCTLTVDGPY